jgi:predicted RecA/RadA family phage recombinase
MSQTMQAVFKQGNYETVDYTPTGADLDAGTVVVLNDKAYICHRTIPEDELGALAARGGVYSMLADGGSGGEVISQGDKLYWDDSSNIATATASGNTPLGWAAADKADVDTEVLVEHGSW